MGKLFKASIRENGLVIKNHYLLTLHPIEKIPKPEPGNFFMLSISDGLDPLLKRPFSLHRWLDGDFQILYRVAGKGTELLSRRRTGDVLDVVGPLGKSFTVNKQNKPILVAGGLGIAPIFALAEKLKKRQPALFYGARTKKEVLCIDELKTLGVDPIVSTDDGTFGAKDNIINVLTKYLARHKSPVSNYCLYACGPKPMLVALSNLAKKFRLKGYIALEQYMACGLGTCLGCVINTTRGYKRVCKEGPVFSTDEVIW
ncbi:MAG: dihydroorotate dehydrogenase electron transfer subunit [Nitrospiraceae bacterium]|nr:MAG: dihydroorotate dehydrogenase electron transfer subunit [Nitrospiraceae bacterium]